MEIYGVDRVSDSDSSHLLRKQSATAHRVLGFGILGRVGVTVRVLCAESQLSLC
jgi:hypothetical protein